MNSKLRSIGATVLLLVCFEFSLRAQCMFDPSPPCQAFSRAEVVFSGVVTQASYSATYQRGEGENRWNYRDRIAHFAVDNVFRGKLGSQVDVIATEIMTTPITLPDGSAGMKTMSDADCDYKFKEGERYLVYAQFRKTNDGSLSVSYNRTRLFAQAVEDLEYIRGLDQAGPGGRVYGQARQNGRDLKNKGNTNVVGTVANVKIIVDGMQQHYETFTDTEGRYQVKGLTPGEYSVQALFPAELTTYPARKARIPDRGCAEVDFITEADARISGKILDAHGQVMPKMRLDLASADQDVSDPNPQTFWAYADENGNYEFKSIPSGRYVLGIGLNAIRDADFAYLRTYYPDASNVTDAKVFLLKAGERIEGVDFVMPPQLTSRTIEGIVVWPDGRPVPNAGIITMISDYSYGIAYGLAATDGAGRFSAKLFNGLSYWVNALVNLPGGKQMHAEPIDVPGSGDIKDLKLVVTSPMGSCERCRFRYGPRKKP
jgi:hypothetical protein